MEKKFQPQDLAALLAQQQGISSEEALNFVRAFFELTEEALVNDSLVKVTGFGTTKLVVVNERESVNIHTGERFQIGKHTKITFTPDNTLRDLVNSPFALLTTTTLYNETPEEELDAVPVVDEEYAEDELTEMPTSENVDNEDAENTAPAVGTTLVEATNSLMDSAQSEEVPEETQAATIATLQIGDTSEDEAQDTAETSVPEQTEVQPISSKEMDAPTDSTSESPESADLTLVQSNTTAEENTTTTEATDNSLNVIPEIVIAEAPTIAEVAQEESTEVCTNPTSQYATVAPSSTQQEATLPNVTNIQGEIHVKTEEVGRKTHHYRAHFNILLFAIVLLLLILSYFAGYYHWLCPNCPQTHAAMSTPAVVTTSHNTTPNPATQIGAPKVDTPENFNDGLTSSAIATKDSAYNDAVPSKSSAAPSNTTAQAKTSLATSSTAESKKNKEVQRIVVKGATLPSQEKEILRSKSRDYQQMPHGKSIIVGTYLTHVVKTGESLPRLAKQYYGNPNYANYIILHNHIVHPDLIKVGERIKIPQLLQE